MGGAYCSRSFVFILIGRCVVLCGAGVNALASVDINGDGVHEIIIGRDDGVVDLFGLDETIFRPVRLCSEV